LLTGRWRGGRPMAGRRSRSRRKYSAKHLRGKKYHIMIAVMHPGSFAIPTASGRIQQALPRRKK
jgi:hypothetical protein